MLHQVYSLSHREIYVGLFKTEAIMICSEDFVY